jgi:hypothetical protein
VLDFDDVDYTRIKKLMTALEAAVKDVGSYDGVGPKAFRPAGRGYAFGNIHVWLGYFKNKGDLETYSGLLQFWLWLNGIDVPEKTLSLDLRKRSPGKPKSDKAYRCWQLRQQGLKIKEIAWKVIPEHAETNIENAVREIYRFLDKFKSSPEGQIVELSRRMLDIPEAHDEDIDALCGETWIVVDDHSGEDDPG